jgi:hypothetical protein
MLNETQMNMPSVWNETNTLESDYGGLMMAEYEEREW